MEREAEGAAQDAQPPRDAGGGRGAAGGEWPEPATRDAAGGIWPVPADGGDRQLARGGTLARDAQPAPAACDADDGARPAARDARAAARDARRDARWVRAVCRRGSRTAAEKLVHAYYDEIYVFAYRQTGCKEDALDLTQGIFMAVLRSLPTFDRRKASFRTWLYRVATNKAIDARRRARPAAVPLDGVEVPASGDFSAQVRNRLFVEQVEAFVSTLDPACRPCSGCTCSPRRASRKSPRRWGRASRR